MIACRQFTATRQVCKENDGGTNLNRMPVELTNASIYCNNKITIVTNTNKYQMSAPFKFTSAKRYLFEME